MKNIDYDLIYCRNCQQRFAEDAKYCHNCSQKRTDGRVTFGEMLNEFTSTVFNLDSRFFQTVFALFVPGKLTEEYFIGKHKSYVHPLRVFLIMTLGLVSAATLSITDADFMGLESDLEEQRMRANRQNFLVELEKVSEKVDTSFQNPRVAAALDSVFYKVSGKRSAAEKDSTNITVFTRNGSGLSGIPYNIAVDDLLYLKPDSIYNKYEIEGFWQRMLAGQQIRLRRKGGNFGAFLFSNITWMVLIMMPILALVLKLLYIRRGYYYVEHLLFSFHTHAFAFLLFITMILFGYKAPGWIIGGGFVVFAVYLFMAMQRVYQQRFWKTFSKYILVTTLYIFLLMMAGILTFLISFAAF